MEDRLIFRYHLNRANAEPELLRKPLHPEGLPTRSAVGKRWGDAEG
jgi:hypothetical protein